MRIDIYTCGIYVVLSYPTLTMHGHMNLKFIHIKLSYNYSRSVFFIDLRALLVFDIYFSRRRIYCNEKCTQITAFQSDVFY